MSQETNLAASDVSVVLLAAGRGQRMMPLTQHTPKPLLKVGEYSLIEHHLRSLKRQGFKHVVINLAYLGEQIKDLLGDGARFDLDIQYSDESSSGALETAGGLRKALPLIKSEHFIVINADIWTNYPFAQLIKSITPHSNTDQCLGTLVMVPNPEHNLDGDFYIDGINRLTESGSSTFTFSGIARYHRSMFSELPEAKQALGPLFHKLSKKGLLEGQTFSGTWIDIGTPERLEQLNLALAKRD